MGHEVCFSPQLSVDLWMFQISSQCKSMRYRGYRNSTTETPAQYRAICDKGDHHYRIRRAAKGKNGWQNCNLRSGLLRIIKRAGLKPWPKLWHNMRASRETELANEHNVQNACDWIGNSVKVAMRHYLQTTEEDFERAVRLQKAKQKAKQYLHARARKESHDEKSDLRNSLLLRQIAISCDTAKHPGEDTESTK